MIVLSTPKGKVEIRELKSVPEMVEAEQVQAQVWGEEAPLHPKEMLIAAQFEGALAAGAFSESGQMVGLVFSFPTRDPAVMHSQLLATLEDWRGLGIGAQLKWFQRDWCLERGIQLVRWTVDPLRAANAELNIRHLGGMASIYLPDYYGPMQGIDAGVPSDRLLLNWFLTSPQVEKLEACLPEDTGFPKACPTNEIQHQKSVQARFDLAGAEILIRIPSDFIALSRADPLLAVDWRMQTRALLLHYFKNGWVINGFTRVGGPAYLLSKV